MARFELHHQLLQDCHRLGRFQLSHLLLHKNAAVPWFILVPEIDSPGDLLDLPEPVRNLAMAEAEITARFIRTELAHDKINFAAIGNIVPSCIFTLSAGARTTPAGPRRCGAVLSKIATTARCVSPC